LETGQIHHQYFALTIYIFRTPILNHDSTGNPKTTSHFHIFYKFTVIICVGFEFMVGAIQTIYSAIKLQTTLTTPFPAMAVDRNRPEARR